MATWTCNVDIPASAGRVVEIDSETEPTPDQVVAALTADEARTLSATAGEDFDCADADVLSVEVLT
ncbi:hypothetical protein DVS28_b0152 (plasmid) [Euzebya pacifica]|uniref:Uncharacterized protein n=1 Tax=Euzebya pacifica TaxID=1608957 RepID=A0A346Y625_9ACTN|nr:hypothetical protein [Euzebya pacifica]AXV09922.1 hypothetical protein DVS28_b0152 [Euzebya pacifica]